MRIERRNRLERERMRGEGRGISLETKEKVHALSCSSREDNHDVFVF